MRIRGSGRWAAVAVIVLVLSQQLTSAVPQDPAPPQVTADLGQLGWLAGTWVSANGGATVEERWTPAAGGSMLGVSRTLKGGRMVAFEFLRIAEREGKLVYLAQPGGRAPATPFTASQIDAASVTFENPQHDFPKRIRYSRRADGTLEASVGGAAGQPTQSWVFKPGTP
jgi:hypothetical protein